MSEFSIRRVAPDEAATLARVRALFEEYAEWLVGAVTSSKLPAELEHFPAPYCPPGGALFVAVAQGGEVIGCVGLKRHTDTEAEMKRLYVTPQARGMGVGAALADAATAEAVRLGYRTLLLTTLPDKMPTAHKMYERRGFAETDNFEDHTHASVKILYLKRDLEPKADQ